MLHQLAIHSGQCRVATGRTPYRLKSAAALSEQYEMRQRPQRYRHDGTIHRRPKYRRHTSYIPLFSSMISARCFFKFFGELAFFCCPWVEDLSGGFVFPLC